MEKTNIFPINFENGKVTHLFTYSLVSVFGEPVEALKTLCGFRISGEQQYDLATWEEVEDVKNGDIPEEDDICRSCLRVHKKNTLKTTEEELRKLKNLILDFYSKITLRNEPENIKLKEEIISLKSKLGIKEKFCKHF